MAKAVAFIVARLTSSRFSAKHFKLVGDKPLLGWTIHHLQKCKEIDSIVLATVSEPANIPLQKYAREIGIECFWYEGAVDHVTTRLRKAAEEFQADICILVSGDCPLIDPTSVDKMVSILRENPNAEVVNLVSHQPNLFPALEGVAVARRSAWQKADDLSTTAELKEHQFPVIGLRPELFNTVQCQLDSELYFSRHRLSVDTQADLEFMRTLYSELLKEKTLFNLPSAIKLLRKKPELRTINSHVHQRGLVEDIRTVLFIVDAGGDYGYGHLTRSLELALQIVERLGWPVTFLIDNERAAKLVRDKGLRVMWGAFERKEALAPESIDISPKEPSDISSFSLIVLDIYWKRNLPPDWKNQFGESIAVILNRTESWALKADQIIIPEVCSASTIKDNIVGGLAYVIIRRSIRQARQDCCDKTIDILAYLQSEEDKKIVKTFAASQKLNTHFITDFTEEFPQTLARSRYYVSGFGYSFYEALFLGAIPITCPISDAHEKAAIFFYHQIGWQPLLLKSGRETQIFSNELLSKNPVVAIEDATHKIVEQIASISSRTVTRK